MPITITLQSASDSIMTEDGYASGTRLADSDLRKVYGLPNMYVNNKNILKFATYESSVSPVKPPRWDTVNAASVTNNLETVKVSGVEIEWGITDTLY